MEEVRGSRAPVLFARNGFMEYDMSVCSPHSPLSACMSIALNPFRANHWQALCRFTKKRLVGRKQL